MAVLLYTSCKKNDVPAQRVANLDTVAIMGFKDSTQLIKSFTSYYLDSGSNVITDSSVAFFHYDTVNRRITIGSGGVSTGEGDFDSLVYQYNSGLLLMQVSFLYSIPPSDPTVAVSIAYTYDVADVIQSATFTEYNGQQYTYSFNKTTLAGGGYQLSWLDTSPTSSAGNTYLASFNSQGQMISNYDYTTSDSLEYDASGNISKIVQTNYLQPYNLNGAVSFTLYDFTSRDTKGDQLYNLYQVLNHGIANLNVDDGNISAELFDVDYIFQFTKYPATSTIINRPYYPSGYCTTCGTYQVTSIATPTYDSQNRLVTYEVFFNDDPLSYEGYHLSYYK